MAEGARQLGVELAELVLEAPEAEIEQTARLTREVMCQAFTLKAPLEVEVSVGENWLEMEEITDHP
jgi:DNA polymerase-1